MVLLVKSARAATLSALALATGLAWLPQTSFAQNFGGFAAGMIARGMMGGRHGGGGYRRHRGGGGGDSDDQGSNQGSDRAKQEQANANANAVAAEEATRKVDLNDKTERQRNVKAAINEFIEVLKAQHKLLEASNSNIRGAFRGGINQLTEGEIRLAVDKAYQEGHLTDFETLAGELWTRDRLQVQILVEAEKGILPYFKGVGAKGPDLNNLQDVFKESAESVYARALELAEIIGVSRSFDHFIRTIYENSDQAPIGLETVGADVRYERMLTNVINDVDRYYFAVESIENQRTSTLTGRLAQQFSFRFRARRALYDCLAASYVSLITGGGSVPSPFMNGPSKAQPGGLLQTGRQGNAIPSKNGAATVVAASADTPENVWKRTRQLVGQTCKELTRPLAQNAMGGGLKPISARTDLAVNAGMAVNRSEGQYLQMRSGE